MYIVHRSRSLQNTGARLWQGRRALLLQTAVGTVFGISLHLVLWTLLPPFRPAAPFSLAQPSASPACSERVLCCSSGAYATLAHCTSCLEGDAFFPTLLFNILGSLGSRESLAGHQWSKRHPLVFPVLGESFKNGVAALGLHQVIMRGRCSLPSVVSVFLCLCKSSTASSTKLLVVMLRRGGTKRIVSNMTCKFLDESVAPIYFSFLSPSRIHLLVHLPAVLIAHNWASAQPSPRFSMPPKNGATLSNAPSADLHCHVGKYRGTRILKWTTK